MKEYGMVIAAVIVTYNRRAFLQNCFNAICSQTYKPDYIVVVDNHSTDGTREWLRELEKKRPDVIPVFLKENMGGAGGFYFGIKKACEFGADWIWTLDDDSLPTRDALEKLIEKGLLEIKSAGAEVGFLASRVLWKDGRCHKMNMPGFVNNEAKNGNAHNKNIRIAYSSFVSVLFNRHAVSKVGLPLKEFFLYSDDIEFTRRIISSGFVAYYVPESKTFHLTEKNAGITYEQIMDKRLDLEKRCRILRNLVIANKGGSWGRVKEAFRILYIWLKLLVSKTPAKSQKKLILAGVKGLLVNHKKWIRYPMD